MGLQDATFFALYPYKAGDDDKSPNLEDKPFYFHTPPSEYRFKGGVSRSSQSVVKIGERARSGGPNLKTVTWSSQFTIEDYLIEEAGPDGYPSYVLAPPGGFEFMGALKSCRLLEKLRDDGDVVRVVIDDPWVASPDWNMLMQVVDFDWGTIQSEPDIRTYSITFVEYKPVIINTVDRAGTRPGQKPRGDSKGRYVDSPFTVPYKKGMGIKAIAYAAYHDRTKWKKIYKANGGKKWLKKIKAKPTKPTNKNGPWIIPHKTKVKIPPIKGI